MKEMWREMDVILKRISDTLWTGTVIVLSGLMQMMTIYSDSAWQFDD
jgi:hypothetical protein